MAAALIGNIKKEEEVKINSMKLPKSLMEELTIYTHYIGGEDGDKAETIRMMIEYVLKRERIGKQGKEYKKFKEKFLSQNSTKSYKEIRENRENNENKDDIEIEENNVE